MPAPTAPRTPGRTTSRARARRAARAAHAGATLVELAVVLTVISLLGAVAFPRAARFADRGTVQGAIAAVASACALARVTAIMRGDFASVLLDTASATVRVVAGRDTVLSHPLGDPTHLTLAATRTTVTYGPTGLGYGAANTTVVARQGSAADTLWTSRLGRVRH